MDDEIVSLYIGIIKYNAIDGREYDNECGCYSCIIARFASKNNIKIERLSHEG